MKRALAITLTVAMIGSLAVVGLAGTAAAGEYPKDKNGDVDPIVVEEGPTITQTSSAEVVQGQDVTQQNVGEQTAVQEADQDATGIDGDANVNVNVNVGDDTDDNNDNNNPDSDSVSVDVGTTGDQSIEQNIVQEQTQVNENNQIGGAEAFNFIG
ncbi:hypothetical protein [Natrarchaeobius chitinivorans]|uniref:Uncharacterized protein n=1 Tax=Natrarchaeobius chitinivorans TaxID=1679083 RepID=A0A3N6N666_NATCH|nr:hypothetical protein [Natrarchaeobius chitinivorans]RQG93842.1 hypothetical protein EA473_14100 [Natrarchaeobius chitinivorans]